MQGLPPIPLDVILSRSLEFARRAPPKVEKSTAIMEALLNLPEYMSSSSEESEDEAALQFKDLGLDARLGE